MADMGARFPLPSPNHGHLMEADWEANNVRIPKIVLYLNLLDMRNDLTLTMWISARFIIIRFSCTYNPPATSHLGHAPNLAGFIACTLGLALELAGIPFSVAFYALGLLQRVKDRHPFSYCDDGHRPFLAAFMVAAKYTYGSNVILANSFWRHTGQRLFSLDEVNEMEEDMLTHLGWLRDIHPNDLRVFEARLQGTLSFAPSAHLILPQSLASPRANQSPPPPAIGAGASYPDPDRRTQSPSPCLPPPGNYSSRPGPNSHGPSSGYASGYLNGEPAWDHERGGRERERKVRDRESDHEGRNSRQRQPSVSNRVKVEILNQHAPANDRFFPNRGGPSSPVASCYDPRRPSPPPERQAAEGRSPYMAAPSQPNAPYPGYWERERERGAPPKAPSRQRSPAPREREGPPSSRRYDPRMDIDQESPRRKYWPADLPYPTAHPLDRARYNATPDSSRRGNRGPEVPANGAESPNPAGLSCAPAPEPAGKTARRCGAQAVASREQPPAPLPPKEKKERKPPSKHGGGESSAVPPEREMSAPVPQAPGSAPVSQAAPSQHPAFKVNMPENNTLPPPPLPAGANHHCSQSGSNGSARLLATPSPTMGRPRREVDEAYDKGVADALMGPSPSSLGAHETQLEALLSLKRRMEDQGSGRLGKRHRVVLNFPVLTVSPPTTLD